MLFCMKKKCLILIKIKKWIIEIEKCMCHYTKSPSLIDDVDIDKSLK